MSPSAQRPAGELSQPQIVTALFILFEAHRHAAELGRPPSDFAVEWEDLAAPGLTRSDARWLLYKGWIKSALETPSTRNGHRSFRYNAPLTFGPGTCFMLTDAGLPEVKKLLPHGKLPSPPPAPHRPPATPGQSHADPERAAPFWDTGAGKLYRGDHIVKHYREPAPDQRCILDAFQEEGWPPRIFDPLPGKPGQDPKRRLQKGIEHLNRAQRHPGIHFFGDGTGEGICWEWA
jgi:hypothetical protein